MQYLSVYKKRLGCNDPQDVFDHLISTLKPTIKSWDYFVNWKKVLENYAKVERELHLLNSLIGKADIALAALNLLQEYPNTIKTIPILLAYREMEISLLTDYQKGFKYEIFDFGKSMDAKKALLFMKSSGLLDLLQEKRI